MASSSWTQPQSQLDPRSQHVPQPTAQASNEGAARRKTVTMAPVVWSAHSVQVSKHFHNTCRNLAEKW